MIDSKWFRFSIDALANRSIGQQSPARSVGLLALMASLCMNTACVSLAKYEPATTAAEQEDQLLQALPEVTNLPDAWQGQANLAIEAQVLPTAWLADFADPALSRLVEQALSNNLNLTAAAARVAAAAAQARIAGAPRLPSLSAGLSGSRTKRSSSSGFSVATPINNSYSLGLDLSWEADLWGRLSAQQQSAVFSQQATLADYQAARLSLAANISRAWCAAIEAQQQLALATRNLRSFQDNLKIVEERYRFGQSTALDLRLLRSNVASTQSQLALAKQTADSSLRSLETLVGRYPAGQLELPKQLPKLPAAIPKGLPLGLLERRPDLQAARARLAAARTDEAIANTNLLPRLAITASGGTASSEFRNLFDLDQLVWSIASNLTAPLFQAGRLRGERELATANADLAVTQYASAALTAFNEVETALAAEAYFAEAHQALSTTVRESSAAETLALEQYSGGLVDITTLLEAQRRSVDAARNLLQLNNQRVQNRINLYLALGGDFAASGEHVAPLKTAVPSVNGREESL